MDIKCLVLSAPYKNTIVLRAYSYGAVVCIRVVAVAPTNLATGDTVFEQKRLRYKYIDRNYCSTHGFAWGIIAKKTREISAWRLVSVP